jgi:drug/metabolite transporter (DMT)-like permease
MEPNHLKGIGFGLSAAICWGLADYVVTNLARRVGTPRAMAFIQTFSLLCWIILLVLPAQLLWGRESVALWSGFSERIGLWPVWAWMLMAGVCHVAGIALSYRAFEIGTLALVAPISSSFAIVTAVLSTLTREALPPSVMAGVGLLFIGIILATRAPTHPEESSKGLLGVPEALGSALAYGVMFWMMLPGEEKLGPVLPLIVLKIMATGSALLGLGVGVMRQQKADRTPDSQDDSASVETMPTANTPLWWMGLASTTAILDSLAWLSYSAGSRSGSTTVVTALASLFSVVTILLAWLLFKDRLAKLQWVGIAIILAGVLLVSAK